MADQVYVSEMAAVHEEKAILPPPHKLAEDQQEPDTVTADVAVEQPDNPENPSCHNSAEKKKAVPENPIHEHHEAYERFTRDRFGFFIENEEELSMNEEQKLAQIRLDNKRLIKWTRMLANNFHYFDAHPNVVKRRVRKGIPDSVRGLVWKKLAQSENFARRHPKGLYQRLLATKSTSWEAQIHRDIHRTFPHHIFFRERSGMGQNSLFNVLKVYAIFDEELGYCQGMGFIAGMFLMHMGEEDSFWMLVMVMKGAYRMRGLYTQGMPVVNLRCWQLRRILEHRHSKLVSHLEREHVDIQSLTMQWFITNYSYNLPFRVLLRIWDIFLLERTPKILFRVAIHFFDLLKPTILKSDFETIMTVMKDFYKNLEPNEVIEAAVKVRIKGKQLEQLETEYLKTNNSQ